MRILAIRGCNLASLAGEFELDLSRAPLGDAGVFAIVGNTGAGKSTLLDALCVALFDRTPRLTNHSRVVIGRGDDDPGALGAQDARTLLRRGAAAGWAEVDFESGDARRYRARWSVRRARGNSAGTLQDQQVTLTAIDNGERFGGTKTETLKAIVARLGLSFDQFRRSALLAQGEFAAFLRADGKDRSELLERMTGTEIYTRLSVAAHLRATLAEQRLRDARTVAFAIPVLDDDARRVAEAGLVLATDAKVATRARAGAAEAAARWLAEAEQRARATAIADAEHAAACAAASAAIADRQELALRRRADKLRASWEAAERLDRALAIARCDLLAAREASEHATGGHAELVTQRGELAELHAPIRAARIAAGLVERAPSVQTNANASSANLRASAASSASVPAGAPAIASVPAGAASSASVPASATPSASVPANDGVEARSGSAPRAYRVLAQGRLALDDAAWLRDRAHLAGELAGWHATDARFEQHAATADAIAAIDRALGGHDARRAQLGAARALVAADHQAAVAKLADAQRKVQAFQQRRGLALDAARRQEDEARTRLADIERLVAIAAGARQAVRARGELDRQLAELEESALSDAAQHECADAARAIATTLRFERARVVDELRRAAGHAHARTELLAGEPCPLCGATEHPWRDRGALDGVIASAQASLDEAAAELDGANATLAAIAAREQHRLREHARLTSHRETTDDSAVGAVGVWRDYLAALGELLLEEDPASPAAERLAADREASAKQRLEAARDVRRQTEAATKAAAEAQAEAQLAQLAVDQQASRLADAERALADLESTAQRLRGERAGRVERLVELSTALRATIERVFANADPAATGGFHGTVEETASGRFRGNAECFERARVALAELAAEWRARGDRVVVAEAALAVALAELGAAARDAELAVAERMAACTNAVRRRDELIVELAVAAEQLAGERAASGFDVDELRALLGAAPARTEELADQLAALDRAVERTRVIAHERAQLVADHERARPSDAALADALQLALHAAAVADAEHHAARLAAVLAADDDARERRAGALAQLDGDEAAVAVDRVLGDVIGSHDGKLFRSFAQSLTLDGLLAVANAHLDELAPRYQLERVPRHDLELQVVDRDLGAEVRSVQSLSGGESFLVSLALALGLSSMSAHDVRVRTLLIDEGFGTLDPATLDGALAVLDALQATGRQVGVISHVPALVERVGAHVRVVQRGGGRSEVIVAR